MRKRLMNPTLSCFTFTDIESLKIVLLLSFDKAMFPKWSELQTEFESRCPESTGADSTSNANFYEVDIPMHACGATYQGTIS